ncbi:D-2-hydroxyacid dehydrogenase [Marinimicrobium sp. ABcell2]|uniref:D-2-hydroxyacid dehydrogenase n=1 Tax=Marinimicrobium sp. ABcell2 TaxID=3069751 RepID=UPI0027B0518E|nr:D-2-hydroxyacid dehydrogenase [Marinimicrobium sp. ABcell2]MDQ2075627.1 D-2-hydroxyacid dehydrogenase [Marinimicrobium sp. ABcell2]
MTHVLILTAEDEPELPGLEELPTSVQVSYARDESALREGLQQADVLVVTDFRSGMIERCWPKQPSVQWVHATSAGVDALMFPALVNSDIPVTNARGVFNRGIAEYVLGAILMFAKDTLGNLHNQRLHRWQHRETHLIHRKQALIVGAGSIGSTVAELLSATGLEVVGTARSAREISGFKAVYAQHQLPELLPNADYVVITAPLTPETKGLFNSDSFAAMKPSAYLINVGRGPIVHTEDLLSALRSGHLAGAALDVFEEEPLPENHPLWDHPNVMVSAHMAGDFIGWRHALGEQFVDNFRRWQAGESLFNKVEKK